MDDLLCNRPVPVTRAAATIRGNSMYPGLCGTAQFSRAGDGVLVRVEVCALPNCCAPCAQNIFGLHIHQGCACEDGPEPFKSAQGHYNPKGCPHPAHAGDMPPLFGNRGYAFMTFYTERFCIEDIVGRTVIVHSQRDDFSSQPAGDAGERIACGVIMPQRDRR